MVLHETIHLWSIVSTASCCITFRLLLGYFCHWRSSWRRAATKPFFIHGLSHWSMLFLQVPIYDGNIHSETYSTYPPRRVNSCLCKISPFHRLALHRTKLHLFAALILLQRLKARLRQLMPMQNYPISSLSSPSNGTTSVHGSHSPPKAQSSTTSTHAHAKLPYFIA